jgi:BirA family biotin operon repressor/biotin-[acetyl-CoA-carboxylase] ligase
MNDLPPPDAVQELPTRHLGRRVWLYDCLDSTNTRALALGDDPAHDGLVLRARAQTAGRGQYGRAWQAPPDSSVLLSVLLFPPPGLRRPALLTSWAAVTVAETICKLTGQQAKIKWPNDVFLGGKKVCGILIEQRNGAQPAQAPATVVGIGLNVTQPPELFEQAGLTLAGSLAAQTGQSFAVEEVSIALIRQLDEEYERLLQGDFAALEVRWCERLGLVGEQVHIEGLQQHYHGRLREVTLSAVQLETVTGELLTLAPEAIRHLSALPDS